MNPVRITYLADAPWHAATLARWHYDTWSGLLPDWTEAEALAELRSHTDRVRIDTTRIALQDGELVGSASLLGEDHPALAQFGNPWLASVFVAPDARRRGIGEALIGACIADAATLGVPRLSLYTEDATALYQRLGWEVIATTTLPTAAVVVMAIAPLNATTRR